MNQSRAEMLAADGTMYQSRIASCGIKFQRPVIHETEHFCLDGIIGVIRNRNAPAQVRAGFYFFFKRSSVTESFLSVSGTETAACP